MLSLSRCSAAAALLLAANLCPAQLVGQQDSTMMSHDSMMAMPADTGMAVSHDSVASTQSYDLPKGKDLTGYTTLLVYSKKTRQGVASADWHATSGKLTEHM